MKTNKSDVGIVLICSLVTGILASVPVANALEERLVEPATRALVFLATGDIKSQDTNEYGVPISKFSNIEGEYYNPVYIAMYGFSYYQAWTGSSEFNYFLDGYIIFPPDLQDPVKSKQHFFGVADWFVDNQVPLVSEGVEAGVWQYHFPWPVYNMTSPWVSGMAQGVGIQVLLRAWETSGEPRYLDVARLARNAFEVPANQGGVTYIEPGVGLWFEEYADPGGNPSWVLNGMEHSLIALHELAIKANDTSAAALFAKGERSLSARIETYDAGWWTYYDAVGQLANLKYHHINIGLTAKIALITGNSTYTQLVEKWAEYDTPFFEREFIRQNPTPLDFMILALAGALPSVGALLLGGLALAFVPRAASSPAPRTICHLTSAHSQDDIRILQKECASLARAGYDVNFVVPGGKSGMLQGVQIIPVQKRRSRFGRFTQTGRDVYRAAIKTNAAVYHFHDPDLLPVGLRLKAKGKHVIYDIHEDVAATIPTKRWLPSWARPLALAWVERQERRADSKLDAIVCATPAIARKFSNPKTVVIENFALGDDLGAVTGKPLSDRLPHVLYAGGLTSIRGIAVMVDAIAQCKDSGSRLILAGPKMEAGLEETLKSSPGWARTDYLGNLARPQLAQVMANVRAGLVLFQPHPNHVESQPNKIFEYMSAGLPIIASDFPLWRDVVEGNGCGICVDPMDADAVARAIDSLLADPERCFEMGRNGRWAVKEKYSWAGAERKLFALYEDLLKPETRAK